VVGDGAWGCFLAALILISCSATKRTDGSLEYRLDDSILSKLDKDTRKKIYQKRQDIFSYIKKGEIVDFVRAGWNRKDHNIELKEGRDLFPDYLHNNNLYKPAYERYYGRFYKKVGNDFFVEAILSENIHTLVVSGLYGLIALEEPIQYYSCHLDDIILSSENQFNSLSSNFKARVSDLWKDEGDSLFNIALKEYIIKQNDLVKDDSKKINLIIDLLSEYSYQRVFQWNKLANWLQFQGIKRYHRVTPELKEPYFLPVLADYYRDEIVKKNNLINLPSQDSPFKTIDGYLYFEPRVQPDPYFEKKLKNIMTIEIWHRLSGKSQDELINAERLFENYEANSSKNPDGPAYPIMNYFIALEIELCNIFNKITNKDGYLVCGTMGDYEHHLKSGSLKGQISWGEIEKLREIRIIRNSAGHPPGINKNQLIRARELIISKFGILPSLMMLKN
jgi:cytoplasmic iron level regulating protein YaaA (DUF328/UPF0246 family)